VNEKGWYGTIRGMKLNQRKNRASRKEKGEKDEEINDRRTR
jgi:hypothetical protein